MKDVPETLLLSEIFGPTIQGEGPNSGRVAWFIRLGGCNLSCSWCDTPYTWDSARFRLREELAPCRVEDIVESIAPGSLVILTGGEPLLQQSQAGWAGVLERLRANGCRLNVETNGTIAPTAVTLHHVDLFVVSPKLANAGPHRGHQRAVLHPAWLQVARHGCVELKFVCRSAEDVAESWSFARDVDWPPGKVWVMPEGDNVDLLSERWPLIVEAAVGLGMNVSHRLHVLTWGARRGK